MSVVFALIALVALVNCGKSYTPAKGISKQQAFEEYNAFFAKTHKNDAEKNARFLNFLHNAQQIALQNKASKASGIEDAAKFGFTKFSDMSPKEFKTKMTGLKLKNPRVRVNVKREALQNAPTGNIDWVAKGKTTAIKNQLQCGSCWAFSATEEIESAMLMAGQTVQGGAPQQIVDCDGNDDGCLGGDPAEAMNWVIAQGGQDLESCYPYTAVDGTCMQTNCNATNKISSTTAISGDEPDIYTALVGAPLSICCDASNWPNYVGGILLGTQCGSDVDHAIQLTGYNTNANNNNGTAIPYWIIRNSWGSDWGENGFIRLQYGQDTCALTTEITLATV